MTEPLSGRKPLLALLMRLLWAAVLALPVWGAQAAVVFTTLHSFTGTNDGAWPCAGLVQGSDGFFYGTTEYNGTTNDRGYWEGYGDGTVFKISTSGALTTLYAFGTVTNASGEPLDGANPCAALVQGSDGNFYGTTSGWGQMGLETNGYGTVFKISANGVLTALYAFGSITNANGNSLDGAYLNGLVQGSDGNFYGTTIGGGTNDAGTVFKISTNGALTSLYSFTGGNDGAYPFAGLVQGSDGNFYGTTRYGGTNTDDAGNGCGTVFKISTNGVLTTLYSFFNGGGIYPSGLVEGSDGYFYGTTSIDGFNGFTFFGWGYVLKISTNGACTSLYSFDDGTNGAWPNGLVQRSDGYLYGTTTYDAWDPEYGGGGKGTVFKISTDGALTTLYSFDNGPGAWPNGLVQGSDGDFYGTTEYGGTNNAGTVFRLTIAPDPQLTIIPSAPYVILTWPTDYNGFSYAGYTLQSTTNLGSSAVWTTVSQEPVVIGGQNIVINTITGAQQFYRLSSP